MATMIINLNNEEPAVPASTAPVNWLADAVNLDATQRNVSGYINPASLEAVGVMMPDGSTLSVSNAGVISATGTLPTLSLSAATTATSATSGSASSLPANPAGYLVVKIGSNQYKIPFYPL